MAGKISDELLAISAMVLTARERGKIVQAANELNAKVEFITE